MKALTVYWLLINLLIVKMTQGIKDSVGGCIYFTALILGTIAYIVVSIVVALYLKDLDKTTVNYVVSNNETFNCYLRDADQCLCNNVSYAFWSTNLNNGIINNIDQTCYSYFSYIKDRKHAIYTNYVIFVCVHVIVGFCTCIYPSIVMMILLCFGFCLAACFG